MYKLHNERCDNLMNYYVGGISFSDDLYHHGILGQKWGIRRFQNLDGSLTPLGKAAYRARKASRTKSDVDNIIESMNQSDREKVLAGSDAYLSIEQGEHVVKRILQKDGNIPVSFFDLLEDEDYTLQVALGTRSGDAYRGKGYASKVAQKGLDYIKKNKDLLPYKRIVWGVMTDNTGSIKIAKKNGFEIDPDSYSKDKKWVNYVYNLE